MRVEVNRPVGRVLKESVEKDPLPSNIKSLASYATDEWNVYLFSNPAGVFCGFVLRTDGRGWVAVYAETELDVLRWFELNLTDGTFEVPAQELTLS